MTPGRLRQIEATVCRARAAGRIDPDVAQDMARKIEAVRRRLRREGRD